MSKPLRIIIGILTILPILYLLFGFFTMAVLVVQEAQTKVGHPMVGPPLIFFVLIVLHILCMFLIMGLLTFYIVHLFKTERVHSDKKALWAVVLFMGNLIAMPVYWYHYIWTEPKPATARPAVQ